MKPCPSRERYYPTPAQQQRHRLFDKVLTALVGHGYNPAERQLIIDVSESAGEHAVALRRHFFMFPEALYVELWRELREFVLHHATDDQVMELLTPVTGIHVVCNSVRENPTRWPAAEATDDAQKSYSRFHGVPPNHIDTIRGWVPGPLILIGTGLDIGYGVQDHRSEKEGWYVHDFGPGVKIYRQAKVNERPDTTLSSFPRDLLVLGNNLGFTYQDSSGRKHEVKGAARKKLCATLPDKRKLVVVGPSGVEFVAWGGRMRVEDWIRD